MTDDEAAAIQGRWAWISRDLLPDASQAKADIRALLDARAALLAEVEQWRAIGRRMANAEPITHTAIEYRPSQPPDGQMAARYTERIIKLDATWRDKARALLEGTQP